MDEYLAAASGFDVDWFVEQWEYPIQQYYDNQGSTSGFVREKAVAYWADKASMTFTRATEVTSVRNPGEISTAFSYRFDFTTVDGTRRCGLNHMAITFADRPGLPIRRIGERTGPSGC